MGQRCKIGGGERASQSESTPAWRGANLGGEGSSPPLVRPKTERQGGKETVSDRKTSAQRRAGRVGAAHFHFPSSERKKRAKLDVDLFRPCFHKVNPSSWHTGGLVTLHFGSGDSLVLVCQDDVALLSLRSTSPHELLHCVRRVMTLPASTATGEEERRKAWLILWEKENGALVCHPPAQSLRGRRGGNPQSAMLGVLGLDPTETTLES